MGKKYRYPEMCWVGRRSIRRHRGSLSKWLHILGISGNMTCCARCDYTSTHYGGHKNRKLYRRYRRLLQRELR